MCSHVVDNLGSFAYFEKEHVFQGEGITSEKGLYRVSLSEPKDGNRSTLRANVQNRIAWFFRVELALIVAEGLDNETIAERLNLSPLVATKWRKPFLEEGKADPLVRMSLFCGPLTKLASR